MTALATRFGRLTRPPDADLLARYVAGRDGAAFAELVRRHGPAVLAACRRITAHAHDADDAFQATFLVLARKAQQVRSGEPVGAWLYGVAVRAARKAAARAGRHRETLVAAVPDVPERTAEPFDPDAARAVAEEVGRLSPKYRAAVVLCELEGRPRAAVARELGIAPGTLSSRLAAARKELADRLAARGFGPAALAALTPAVVPPRLSAATAALVAGGAVPAGVTTLTHGVGRVMIVQKLRLAAPAFGVAAAVVLAVGLIAAPPAPATPPAPAVRVAGDQPPAPKAVAKGPNKILVYKSGSLVLIDPDGKNETRVTGKRPGFTPSTATRLSPDGTRVALLVPTVKREAPDEETQVLYLHTIGGAWPGTNTGVECNVAEWAPDGSRLAACKDDEDGKKTPEISGHVLIDARTRVLTPLRLPSDHVIAGWAAGGDRLITTSFVGTPGALEAHVHLMNLDGTEHRRLTGPRPIPTPVFPILSPGGKRTLCWDLPLAGPGAPAPAQEDAFVLDLTTGKRTPFEEFPPNGDLEGFCWSPDGTKIAYVWRQVHTGRTDDLDHRETESRLIVADADGKNPRTILTEKGRGQWAVTLCGPDWR